MTDNEIIKALEWVVNCNGRNVVDCIGCPLAEFYPCCEEKALEFALDLINRQKAEIERLNSRKEVVVPSMRLIDGNPLNGFNLESHRFVARTVEDVKAEAYKEFAEEVNKELFGEEYQLDKAHRRAVERALNRLTSKE